MTQVGNSESYHLDVEQLLTPADLACMLQRSPRTIRNWRARGLLPVPDLVVERTVRWRRQTIDTWLDGHRTPLTPPTFPA
ncbi:MAG: helix-turn-helix domain-containing protein [Planctomycetota bacterium]